MYKYSLSVHATAASKATENRTAIFFVDIYKEFLEEPIHTPTKDSVKLISGCRYRDGEGRRDSNALDMSIAIIDYDNDHDGDPTQPWHVHGKLEGIEHAVATTHSNSEEKPKWRLFIPLARPIAIDEWRVIWDYLYNRLLSDLGTPDAGIDTSCKAFSRSYYLPSCQEHLDDLFYSDYKLGRALDVDEILSWYTPAQIEAVKSTSGQPVQRTGIRHAAGHRSTALLRVIGGMIKAGKSVEQTIEEAIAYDQSKHTIQYFTDVRPDKPNHKGFSPTNPYIAARKMVESVARSHASTGRQTNTKPRQKIPLFC